MHCLIAVPLAYALVIGKLYVPEVIAIEILVVVLLWSRLHIHLVLNHTLPPVQTEEPLLSMVPVLLSLSRDLSAEQLGYKHESEGRKWLW